MLVAPPVTSVAVRALLNSNFIWSCFELDVPTCNVSCRLPVPPLAPGAPVRIFVPLKLVESAILSATESKDFAWESNTARCSSFQIPLAASSDICKYLFYICKSCISSI